MQQIGAKGNLHFYYDPRYEIDFLQNCATDKKEKIKYFFSITLALQSQTNFCGKA
jgi:hypothetical protein